MTACCLCADTAAAALLSTGLLTGYAPGLWTIGDRVTRTPLKLLYKISPVPICYSRQPPFHEMHHAGVPLFKKGLKTKRIKDT